MFFGKISVKNSKGNILAHTLNVNNKKLSKGKIISREDIKLLINSGYETITCAVSDKNDIHEDKIAKLSGKLFSNNSIIIEEPFTGRANLLAKKSGLLVIDERTINKFNSTSEHITLATLNNYSRINKGDMIATIKIIPFYVNSSVLNKINKIVLNKAIYIHSFNKKAVGLILTHNNLENIKLNTISKNRITERLEKLNSYLKVICTCAHDEQLISKHIKNILKQKCDLILILGASAIIDKNDIIPTAIKASNGQIIRFGMPVDPGNLLLIGKIKNVPVIGLPGCARSPSLNGFDWVLERLISDINLSNKDVYEMGVGGLLKTLNKNKSKINTYKVSNIILAAGQSKRMSHVNKLLLTIGNKTMIEKVINMACKSIANSNVIVLGHENKELEKFVNKDFIIAKNNDYKKGLSTSVKKGISALPDDCDAAIILLGDMPKITSRLINDLIKAYAPNKNKHIVTPSYNGKRGNPILIGRKFFPDILNLKGDMGAKNILTQNKDVILNLPQKNNSSMIDIDTNKDFKKYYS